MYVKVDVSICKSKVLSVSIFEEIQKILPSALRRAKGKRSKMLCLLALTGAPAETANGQNRALGPQAGSRSEQQQQQYSCHQKVKAFIFLWCAHRRQGRHAHSAVYGEVHSCYLHQQAPPACTAHGPLHIPAIRSRIPCLLHATEQPRDERRDSRESTAAADGANRRG